MGPFRFAVGVAIWLVAAGAQAASIAGQVLDTSGAGLPGQVFLSPPSSKGWEIQQIYTTPANGAYTLNSLAPGDYRIFVRASTGTNYADRWYDVAPPNSSGWIGEDADTLTLANSGSTVTGINLQLPVMGGIDGHVRNGAGTYLAGMWARAQWRIDGRYHHNDQTKGVPQLGLFSMRGLVPNDRFLFIIYDPNASYRTAVFPGPYTVTPNSNLQLGDFVISPMPSDPYEPNNTMGQSGATIDGSGLHAIPPQPFITSGALIGPRNADIDWYCFDAVVGDHFRLITNTDVTVPAGTQEHPWVDPVVGWWTHDGTTLGAWSDDAPNTLNADLEVWVATPGRHCAVVTTYPDTNWQGFNQYSAGMYGLRIDMLNRRPVLTLTAQGAPTPLPPGALVHGEGETLVIDLGYTDPDRDAMTVDVQHTDSLGADVLGGNLVAGPDTGTFTWTIPGTGAENGPYTLMFTVSDGEFDEVGVVKIEVTDVVPTPVPIFPYHGAGIHGGHYPAHGGDGRGGSLRTDPSRCRVDRESRS